MPAGPPLPRRGRGGGFGAPRLTARSGDATQRWPLTGEIFPAGADAQAPRHAEISGLLRLVAESLRSAGERLLGERYVLRLEVLVDALESAFPAEAGLLDAAERRRR